MVRGGIVLVTALGLAACDDAPARPAPRPAAPSQGARELIALAMGQAIADAEQARRLIAPPPPPPPPPDQITALVDIDDIQGRLFDLDPSQGGGIAGGTLGFAPSDDPDADRDDDPDAVYGLGGTAAPADSVRVVLTSDADGVDPVVIEAQRGMLLVRATMCQHRASPGDATTTATVTVSRSSGGARSVRVNSSGPLGSCLKDLSYPDLPPGTTLTFQLTIPAP